MKHNIAVIGFGFMGMTHAINILKNPHLKLAAIVEKDPEKVHRQLAGQSGNFSTGDLDAKELSSVRIYTDLNECLNNESIDACVVAVHADQHYGLTLMALDAGLHVFLEKPFCLDAGQGEALISLARERTLTLMVGHVVRFMPAYLTLKNWIENREFGRLEFLSLSRYSGLPSWGQWKEKQLDFGSTGGALFDLIIHDIDFAQWVCGVPDDIEAQCLPGKLSSHDYVSALWAYRDTGLRVRIDGGNTFHSAFPFQASYAARFEHASVLLSCKDPENIMVATDSEIRRVPAGDANDGFSGEIDYFARCLGSGEPPLKCMPESALQTIRLCYDHIK